MSVPVMQHTWHTEMNQSFGICRVGLMPCSQATLERLELLPMLTFQQEKPIFQAAFEYRSCIDGANCADFSALFLSCNAFVCMHGAALQLILFVCLQAESPAAACQAHPMVIGRCKHY